MNRIEEYDDGYASKEDFEAAGADGPDDVEDNTAYEEEEELDYREAQKRMNNEDFVLDMMRWSSFGALAQIFIIDAIGKQAQRVAETPIEEVRKAFGDGSFIHPDAWHGVATEIFTKMKERLK